MLDHAGLVAGACFLDLFCGTGAVGIEAWSRQADEVWLMDREVALARSNVEALGNPPSVRVRPLDVTSLGRRSADHPEDRLGRLGRRFDVVFMDPPYGSGLAEPALSALRRGWLADDALIVVELAARETLAVPTGFVEERDRRYGAARLVSLRFGPDGFETGPS